MINDIPRCTWWLPELCQQASIETPSLRTNAYRGKLVWDRPDVPLRPFHWEGPNGATVFTWYTDSYRGANFARESDPTGDRVLANVLGHVRRNEARGYPFDALLLGAGGNNLPVTRQIAENIRRWNETRVFPQLHFATHSDFFDHLIARYAGRFERVRGDTPGCWVDGAASSAFETGLNRRTHRGLGNAERLAALAAEAGRSSYPADALATSCEGLLLYDEHTWGSSTSVTEPYSLQTRGQWAQKAAFAYRAAVMADRLIERSAAALLGRAGSPDDAMVIVLNPHPWQHSNFVEIELPVTYQPEEAFAVRDLETGEIASHHVIGESRDALSLALLVREIGPFGWRRFAIEAVHGPCRQETLLASGENWLENAHYRLSTDTNGAVVSIVDKALGRELVNRQALYRLNQLIYESYTGGRGTCAKPDRPAVMCPTGFDPRWAGTATRHRSRHSATIRHGGLGPLVGSQKGDAQIEGRIRPTAAIVLSAHARELRVINRVDKEETLAEEAAYLAFPFELARPSVRCEIACAVMRPERDQLPGSARDFSSVQSWVGLFEDDWGVTWSRLEAPVVHVGGLHYEAWLDRLDVNRGWLFSHPFNNHWDTNYRASQGGPHICRYTITSRAGPCDDAAAPRFGCNASNPPVAWLGSRRSPLVDLPTVEISESNVILLALKRAEDGDGPIVGFQEIAGRPGSALICLPGRSTVVGWRTDLLENNQDPLTTRSREVNASLPPRSVVTVRLIGR